MLKKLKLSGSMKTHIPSRTNTKNTNKGLKCKRSQEIPGVTDKFGLGVQNEAGAKANKVLPSEHTDHSKHTLHQHKRWLTRWSIPKSD